MLSAMNAVCEANKMINKWGYLWGG